LNAVSVIVVIGVGLVIAGMWRSRAELDSAIERGRAAIEAGQYAVAVATLTDALNREPASLDARGLLGTALARQYVPGDDSPDNIALSLAARQQFERVLQEQPADTHALASLASLYFDQQRYAEARQMYQRLTAVAPTADAYTKLGTAVWYEFLPVHALARADSAMTLDQPGPLPDAQRRRVLRDEWLPLIDDGLRHLSKAIEIDPECDTAMVTAAMLARARADLAATATDYDRDLEAARRFTESARAIRRARAERPGK
jgi:tetratricopeptide (TPR) repeat protein